ncbi:hypothetical protein L195_g018017 [Trifolium pratense]|uniref:Uncharacterized protein n=1 Tax=Trifolium pratense TaxID=57577 RepID=A0A2K3MVP7_TRIPR|nr:hypothetical protein L195_g018017 [Trifolium pratense]
MIVQYLHPNRRETTFEQIQTEKKQPWNFHNGAEKGNNEPRRKGNEHLGNSPWGHRDPQGVDRTAASLGYILTVADEIGNG